MKVIKVKYKGHKEVPEGVYDANIQEDNAIIFHHTGWWRVDLSQIEVVDEN